MEVSMEVFFGEHLSGVGHVGGYSGHANGKTSEE
jgi:hypothetical protein